MTSIILTGHSPDALGQMDIGPAHVQPIDSVRLIPGMQRAGQAYAATRVDNDPHFKGFF